MFVHSTQLKYWTFASTSDLSELRKEANKKFIEMNGQQMEESDRSRYFLSMDDERKLCLHYQDVMRDFCSKFQPPMPKYILATAMMYFRRFYLKNSVMDYHPSDIVYSSVYLACKVEEFNVSIRQFVDNLSADQQEEAPQAILGLELSIMQQLHYHLTVHNPYRPLEGLLIDIKTFSADFVGAEQLRQGADEFLSKALHSDVPLMFAPSQIALAALLHSANLRGINLDSYVKRKLSSPANEDNLKRNLEHIEKIHKLVRSVETWSRDEIPLIAAKLEACRSHENDPRSEIYKMKMAEMFDDDDDRQINNVSDQELLGLGKLANS